MTIGTCIRLTHLTEDLQRAVDLGFDTVELYANDTLRGADLRALWPRMREIIGDAGITVSGIGLYGNPLVCEETRRDLRRCIEAAPALGCGFVGTFAGALPGRCVPEAIPAFRDCFSELTRVAEDCGVRIGLENAPMNGHWYSATCNLAFQPRAWELLFDAVPSDRLGLEWEPSHQVEQLIDPLPQLKAWLPRVFHLHGKDASIDWPRVRREGIWFGTHYCDHRFPGLGDTDWGALLRVLRDGGWQGDIAVEGFHDPLYRDDRETEGQALALRHLREALRTIGEDGEVQP